MYPSLYGWTVTLYIVLCRWAGRAAMSQEMSTRMWSDLARVMSSLRAVPQDKLDLMEPSAMQAHVRAMEQLEDIVNTFSKLRDVEVHEYP